MMKDSIGYLAGCRNGQRLSTFTLDTNHLPLLASKVTSKSASKRVAEGTVPSASGPVIRVAALSAWVALLEGLSSSLTVGRHWQSRSPPSSPASWSWSVKRSAPHCSMCPPNPRMVLFTVRSPTSELPLPLASSSRVQISLLFGMNKVSELLIGQ
ncbi:hypothetical protein P389DRAFT_30397 [Cystobasidium minutum MCA 4210]|uniref:uncharacterized protein n=1 Tax=Cystobasidium minutum MCA 4210 TaxID=1397322 RepID=UPI0034CD8B09|eukprot:jgi/Rhomi1/30397/CE30396_29